MSDAPKSAAPAAEQETDFFGTEAVFQPDGSKTVRHRGGFEPRLLTESELRPWLILAQKTLEKDGLWPTEDSTCNVAQAA